MKKLLVNAPTGRLEIVEIGEGGGYFDESRIVHDERKAGPLKVPEPPQGDGKVARIAGYSKGAVTWTLEDVPEEAAMSKEQILIEIENLKQIAENML